MIGVGERFPLFELQGVDINNKMVGVSNYNISNTWAVVYFYPKDFTFICPTEIQGMDTIKDAVVIGISGDNEFCKLAWKESNDLIANIKHTLAADCGLFLADELGIVDQDAGVCLRATYIIDDTGVIQHLSVNALDTGRNHLEVQRTLEALKAGGLTGCSWSIGDDFVA